MGILIKYLFVFDWLTLHWLFENFLYFSESGMVASSAGWWKVQNYCFKIYLDNDLDKQ